MQGCCARLLFCSQWPTGWWWRRRVVSYGNITKLNNSRQVIRLRWASTRSAAFQRRHRRRYATRNLLMVTGLIPTRFQTVNDLLNAIETDQNRRIIISNAIMIDYGTRQGVGGGGVKGAWGGRGRIWWPLEDIQCHHCEDVCDVVSIGAAHASLHPPKMRRALSASRRRQRLSRPTNDNATK